MNQVVRRRWARVLISLVGIAVMLVPAAQARADDDDPAPVQWPKIDPPDAGGNESDPVPVKWATITAPESNTDSNDPKPVKWPAPESTG